MLFVMDSLRVLLANELRSYRQTMAITLRALRPNADVVAVEPEDLEAEVNRLCPHVVLCSRTTPPVRRFFPAWVELYRELDASVSYVSVRGERSKNVGGMELGEVLSIIDQTRPASSHPH
jgi:hypothetical protein